MEKGHCLLVKKMNGRIKPDFVTNSTSRGTCMCPVKNNKIRSRLG